MWGAITRDLQEFVSVVKSDAADALSSAMSSAGQEGELAPPPSAGPAEEQKKERREKKESAAVRLLRTEAKTFTEPVAPEDRESFAAFLDRFDVNGERESAEIQRLLAVDQVMQKMHRDLVPEHVNDGSFWTRYFFRVSLLDAAARSAVDLSFTEQDIAEDLTLTWDDDADAESGADAAGEAGPGAGTGAAHAGHDGLGPGSESTAVAAAAAAAAAPPQAAAAAAGAPGAPTREDGGPAAAGREGAGRSEVEQLRSALVATERQLGELRNERNSLQKRVEELEEEVARLTAERPGEEGKRAGAGAEAEAEAAEDVPSQASSEFSLVSGAAADPAPQQPRVSPTPMSLEEDDGWEEWS